MSETDTRKRLFSKCIQQTPHFEFGSPNFEGLGIEIRELYRISLCLRYVCVKFPFRRPRPMCDDDVVLGRSRGRDG